MKWRIMHSDRVHAIQLLTPDTAHPWQWVRVDTRRETRFASERRAHCSLNQIRLRWPAVRYVTSVETVQE